MDTREFENLKQSKSRESIFEKFLHQPRSTTQYVSTVLSPLIILAQVLEDHGPPKRVVVHSGDVEKARQLAEKYNVPGMRNYLNDKLDALLNEFETEKTDFHENEDRVLDHLKRVVPDVEIDVRSTSVSEFGKSISDVEAEYKKVKDEDKTEMHNLKVQLEDLRGKVTTAERQLDGLTAEKKNLLSQLEKGGEYEVIEHKTTVGVRGSIRESSVNRFIKKAIKDRVNEEAESIKSINKDLKSQVQYQLLQLKNLRKGKEIGGGDPEELRRRYDVLGKYDIFKSW